MQMDEAKLEKYKMKRVFKIQREIERDESN